MSYTPEELLKIAVSYDQIAVKSFVVEAKKKEKKKLDPKAKVRNRGTVCVPAANAKDKKDHFPINDEGQARSALSRVEGLTSAPWYNGSLEGLRALVKRKVHSKYPKIGKSDKKKSSAMVDHLINKYGQSDPNDYTADQLIQMGPRQVQEWYQSGFLNPDKYQQVVSKLQEMRSQEGAAGEKAVQEGTAKNTGQGMYDMSQDWSGNDPTPPVGAAPTPASPKPNTPARGPAGNWNPALQTDPNKTPGAGSDVYVGKGTEQALDSSAVKQIQKFLSDLGYELGRTGVDGKMGPVTSKAIADYQKNMGRTNTGANDPQTTKDLFSDIQKNMGGMTAEMPGNTEAGGGVDWDAMTGLVQSGAQMSKQLQTAQQNGSLTTNSKLYLGQVQQLANQIQSAYDLVTKTVNQPNVPVATKEKAKALQFNIGSAKANMDQWLKALTNMTGTQRVASVDRLIEKYGR